ncbi:acetyltransferase (GNAT) domain-containing protein [Terrimicrobium sacchariphilum]|jgi:GNAT superfamily N-acetyltransferase|uniref:Acetyltransferase (GNAT) domain-containing protein n=1 Tax=Terrimicrobium sacchariphilum TaxID=690879 RepID=A0A146GDC1_TERSA|nr:GNAT family N-acetyltransferase [Terrimicrobium sacchariphilum]GAT34734.1 acetyltransferase (GNAT) domain-containing protein [Terrimicrobium sacchariphilum]
MIRYSATETITVGQFRDVLVRSTLGERRPLDREDTLDAMLTNASLLATAWDGELLVGIARSVTDFAYCCYISDLAVDEAYQRQGIGRQLIEATAQRLGPHCKIILLAAPKADTYYGGVGFQRHPRAWVRDKS